MHSSTLLSLFSVFLLANSTPVKTKNFQVKESHPAPARWKRSAPAPSQHVIELQIGLKQGKLDELQRHLLEVSDPFHERYGKHLTNDEVVELVQPSNTTSLLVHEWLQEHGISTTELDYAPAGDWIYVSLPVHKVEKMIDSKYSIFEHDEGHFAVRTEEWSLPIYLHEHIETIQPTNAFFSIEARHASKNRAQKKKRGVPAPAGSSKLSKRIGYPQSCKKTWDPDGVTREYHDLECVVDLYGVHSYDAKAPGKVTMAEANFHDETPLRSDIHDFLAQYRPEALPGANFPIVKIANGTNYQECGDLCNIYGWNQNADQDVEFMLGVGYPAKLTAYNVGGLPPFQNDPSQWDNTNEPFLSLTNFMLKQKTPAQILSLSYSDREQTVPKSYATAVCNQFMQLGAKGVSILAMAGEQGVGPNGFCENNQLNPAYIPEFPASCPWVTTVGATMLQGAGEVVAYDDSFNGDPFASGAGYSNYFLQPSYQSAVVNAYTKTVPAGMKSKFNVNGRAYPDLSALGVDVATAWDGATLEIVDGTSVATPMVAGIVANLNDARIAAGKAPMGFLNPFLYAVGSQGFTDVVSGSSHGCLETGFLAKKGWDAASGWGTPNFPALLAKALTF